MAVLTLDDRSSAGNSATRSGRTGRQVSRLEQANTELLARLKERGAELEAARAANRELTRARNRKEAAHR
ncbi:hypothetical protein [Streptomyces lutosisoli]|uniref:Transposase n=1 Tax=Streptomyces lutosisoli TaxID=2665721 RepID=A0ABW2VTY2_9ACTN